MIEQAELNRLQQRQLWNYLPELQAMVSLLNNKTLNAEELLNFIYGLQIQFDKLKKETELLSNVIQPQVAHKAPLEARPVQPKVLADKGIVSEIEPK